MPNYPELTYRFPTLNNGDQPDVRPQITLDWSVDMEVTQFSDNSKRAEFFVLMDDSTSTNIGTDFVSYAPSSKRLVLQPSSNLGPGKTYRIIVKGKLVSTDGRKSINEYNWSFNTTQSALAPTNLFSPADESLQPIFPTLSWSAVTSTGMVQYLVQIDDDWQFNSPNYFATTSSTALTPAGVFTDSTTYYWRVMAFTVTVSAEWSETRSFFFGRQIAEDATSRQNFPDPAFFSINKEMVNGLSNMPAYPNISFTFTTTPASDFSSNITIISKSVLPRNDDLTTYNDNIVTGNWSQSGKTITFIPTSPISNNTRYELVLSSTLADSTGFQLGKDFKYYWTGRYAPYYVHARAIRSRFLSAEQNVPDDLINFYIYMASLEANARYYGYMVCSTLDSFGDSLLESTVRDNTNLKSFGVLKWVEANATYKLLKAILFENTRDIGRTEKLGDGEMSLSADFVKGIQAALEETKEELTQWESYLVPSDIPVSASKSADWSTFAYNWDWSIRGHEGIRDDWFDGRRW